MTSLKKQKVYYRIQEQKNQAYCPKSVTIHNSKIGLWKGETLVAICDRISQSRAYKKLWEEAESAFQYFIDGYPEDLPNFKKL
jgi:hypothetical protein